MSKIYFVTRHPGAVEWINRHHQFQDDIETEIVSNFDNKIKINENTVVIGNLPVNLIEKICKEKGKYFHLTFDNIPFEMRGKEMSADDMEKYNAAIEEFIVIKPT